MEVEGCLPVSPAGFYKIILPGIILHKKLRIPHNFAETYGDELSRVVTLVIPDGSLWPVKLEKSDGMLCFSNGWQKLVDRYSIESGHVLIFKYRGNSCFNVFIFDMTSTEINYSRHPLDGCMGSQSDEEEMDSDLNSLTSQVMPERVGKPRVVNDGEDKYYQTMAFGTQKAIPSRRDKVQFGRRKHSVTADETKQVSTRAGKGKGVSDECKSLLVTREEAAAKLHIRPCFVDFLRNTLLTVQEKNRAIFAGRVFTSGNPAFMTVVRQYNLYKTYQMDAPVEFSASYLLPAKTVELEIADGRRWTVHSMEANGGVATLKRGWGTFAKANRLAVGDICIFEAIRVMHVVLKVSIFRSNQD